MFLLKIMSSQDLADNDLAKNYKMIVLGSGDQFEFYHASTCGSPMVAITPKEGETYRVTLTGNAYVVSETGKTVSSHWARTIAVQSDPIFDSATPQADTKEINNLVK